jgi:hypothetical protein
VLLPVETEKLRLDAGDYRLKEYPECCVVERKASPLELTKNLFDRADQVRQAEAFRRLSLVEFPYLLIEARVSSLLQSTAPPSLTGLPAAADGELLLHRLFLAAAKYNLRLLWWTASSAQGRYHLGLALLHLMLGHAFRRLLDVPLDINDLPTLADLREPQYNEGQKGS